MYLDDVIPESWNPESNRVPYRIRDEILDLSGLAYFCFEKGLYSQHTTFSFIYKGA